MKGESESEGKVTNLAINVKAILANDHPTTHHRNDNEEDTMFTPVETSIGAILLHQATSNLLYHNGNILGASGLLRQLFTTPTKETIAFFAGMAASFVPLQALAPQSIPSYPAVPMTSQVAFVTIAVGAVVGLGTKVSYITEVSAVVVD